MGSTSAMLSVAAAADRRSSVHPPPPKHSSRVSAASIRGRARNRSRTRSNRRNWASPMTSFHLASPTASGRSPPPASPSPNTATSTSWLVRAAGSGTVPETTRTRCPPRVSGPAYHRAQARQTPSKCGPATLLANV
ncbi:MAG TPA: hypothetical protein VFX70_06645 [Mycobacteriales bacterium]|nr:hypothetical protein [Mycobacteriales bacterium]